MVCGLADAGSGDKDSLLLDYNRKKIFISLPPEANHHPMPAFSLTLLLFLEKKDVKC